MKPLDITLSSSAYDRIKQAARAQQPGAHTDETWRWFCAACTGMTLQQIEDASGYPWGTILDWSISDRVPAEAYIAVRDFPGEKRRFSRLPGAAPAGEIIP